MEIDIINPHATRKRKFACDSCGITYSKSEYKALYDARKIIYFRLPRIPNKRKEIIICHDCFYKYAVSLFELKKHKNDEYISVNMVDGKTVYKCKIYPNKDISFLDEI